MSSPLLHPATFEFLKAINEHNTRAYFASIRPLYDEIVYSVQVFCQAVIDELSKRDDRLAGLQAKACLFRIYRDARRLHEGDQIYKNNFGFYITPTGKNSKQAGYYVHIQSGESFFGGGIYRADSLQLMQIRAKLIEQGDTYIKITKTKKFKTTFGAVQGESSKAMPRGFSGDLPHSDLIKRKQHLIYHHYDDELVLSDKFFDTVIAHCHIAKPWFDRLNTL